MPTSDKREYGPRAIAAIVPRVQKSLKSAVNSGIVGDARHFNGYHRSRRALLSRGKMADYSIQAPADKRGDEDACSALDMRMNPRDMKTATRRLMVACESGDPRIESLREFYGTLDGRKVIGYNRYRTGRPVGRVTSDPSHLWHIHISFFRAYANDTTAMQDIADVLCGVPRKDVIRPKPKPKTGPKPGVYYVNVRSTLLGLSKTGAKKTERGRGHRLRITRFERRFGRLNGVTPFGTYYAMQYLSPDPVK